MEIKKFSHSQIFRHDLRLTWSLSSILNRVSSFCMWSRCFSTWDGYQYTNQLYGARVRGSDLICDANRKFEAFTHCWHSSLLASASDLPFFFLPAAPTKLSISASNWSTCNSLLSPHIKPNEVQPECWECQCTGWASPSCRSAPARQGPSGRKRWGPARQEIFRKLV